MLLIVGIAIFASFTTVKPTLADTSTHPGLTYFSEVVITGTPGKTQVLLERYGLSQLLYPDRNVLRLCDASDGRFLCFQEPDAGPEYLKLKNTSVLSFEPSTSKSYLIPALEIVGSVIAINGFARLAFHNETTDGEKTYNSDFSTFWDNLVHRSWQVDYDKFSTNQANHPYQGTLYHGSARSAGLNFWESMGYTFLGSALWETAGETTHPSVNDQVASGIAANFLGEPLFRMASLLLEGQDPGFLRELGAAAISPPTGFNRLAFGERFKAVFPSHNPAAFWHLDIGSNIIAHHGGPDTGDRQDYGAMAGFSMEYGLPGKPGYRYTRPFDYFQFEAAAATNYSTALGILSTRGLLLGSEYAFGDMYNGVWGLYGSYDYISPDPVRVSTTALSIGTTAQWRLSPGIALQGTVLGGIGYGAGGNISGSPDRHYHYGGDVQSALDLRLILGDLAMLDFRGRQFYISEVASTAPQGSENIVRIGVGFTLRVIDRHAIGLRYQFANRDTHYRGVENLNQNTDVVSLVYTFLSDEGFGAVDNHILRAR